MRASLKLQTSEPANKNGYPVYLTLRDAGKMPRKKTLFRCRAEDFDLESMTVLETHPQYQNVIGLFMNTKAKVKNVNFGDYSYEEAVLYLFGDIDAGNVFYDEAMKLSNSTKNGQLYKTVLNSFNFFQLTN